MGDVNPQNVKEIIEIPSSDEAKKYQDLGWEVVDTYKVDQAQFFVLAWAKDGSPVKP